MARTSGGLNKRNYQFTDEQIARISEVATEGHHGKEAAAVRELVDLGYRVYQRRKQISQPVEDLALDLIAREVA